MVSEVSYDMLIQEVNMFARVRDDSISFDRLHFDKVPGKELMYDVSVKGRSENYTADGESMQFTAIPYLLGLMERVALEGPSVLPDKMVVGDYLEITGL